MGYIYQYDKRHNVTYVYEKAEKIDPKTGKTVHGRKIVGRLDPETNTIVATGKRGRKPTKEKKQPVSSHPDTTDYAQQYKETNIELKKAQDLLNEANQQVATYQDQLSQIRALLSQGMHVLDQGSSVT